MDNNVENNRKKIIIRAVIAVVYLVLTVAISVLVYPYVNDMTTHEGRMHLKELMESYKWLGILLFVVVQALQVIIVIIPPVQIIGGMLYGWFFGAVLSYAGLFLGSVAVFWLVKLIGYPLVETFIAKKHIKKFKFLEDEKRLEFILFLLFLIPGVPKDALAYLVPLTKIKPRNYFLYVLPARIPAVIISTVFGKNVVSGNIPGTIIVTAILIILAFLGFFYKDKIINKLHRKKKPQKKSDNDKKNT